MSRLAVSAIVLVAMIFFALSNILVAERRNMNETPILVSVEKGYEVWKPSNMKTIIDYGVGYLPIKNSAYISLYIEWWIHNVGYYITNPFTFIPKIDKLNKRFETVDLEIWPTR